MPLHEALGKQTMKVVREGSKNHFAGPAAARLSPSTATRMR